MIDSPESRVSLREQPAQVAQTLPTGFEIQNGKLFYHGIDLMSLVQRPVNNRGRIEMPSTPLYVRRLPALRSNYLQLQDWFESAKRQTDFPGEMTIAYASKANPSEPVARTILQMGAAHECSSSFDIDVVRHAYAAGWIDTDRIVFANGFKISSYTRNLLQLRAEGFSHVVPIFDDLDEIEPFAESPYTFEVGVRSRVEGKNNEPNRFGMPLADMEYAAWRVMNTENLTLTTFHAMQTVSMKKTEAYLNVLRKSLRQYAAVWRIAPTLHRYNLGGGLPGRNSGVDFRSLFVNILQTILDVCYEENIPVPDLIVEPGRYMVQDHAFKIFNIVKAKAAENGIPFYMVDGSIMSNFPDAWALGDQFTVLPLNHWDAPFAETRLAGLTCDRDDIYPTHAMHNVSLQLPTDSDGLIVGFFECGAYQETLGGRNGTKHCLLPEGSELILDEDADGELMITHVAGQTVTDVLANLGYQPQYENVYSLPVAL
jgi:arginine decarboxylase